jgi:hypothetical protein
MKDLVDDNSFLRAPRFDSPALLENFRLSSSISGVHTSEITSLLFSDENHIPPFFVSGREFSESLSRLVCEHGGAIHILALRLHIQTSLLRLDSHKVKQQRKKMSGPRCAQNGCHCTPGHALVNSLH